MAIPSLVAAARSHLELMNSLPRECRDTIAHLAAGAADAMGILAPNLRVTSRMLEARMAQLARLMEADGDDMMAGLGAQAIREVVTRRQREKGLPESIVAPF